MFCTFWRKNRLKVWDPSRIPFFLPYDPPLHTLEFWNPINGSFWLFFYFWNYEITHFFHFLTLDQLVVDTLGVSSVRTYICPSLFFSETSHKIYWSFIWGSVQKHFFLNVHRFGHYGQKLSKIVLFDPKCPKNEGFFAFFSRTTLQIFLTFCTKHSLCSRFGFFVFEKSFKNGQLWSNCTCFQHFFCQKLIYFVDMIYCFLPYTLFL